MRLIDRSDVPLSDGQRHLDAVYNDRFWIFTDLNMMAVLADQHHSIMQNRNPAPPMQS